MSNLDSDVSPATDRETVEHDLEDSQRLLTFTGGGWVLVLAAVLCVAVVVRSLGFREPNGFDLSNSRVPIDKVLVAVKRDGFPALEAPEALLQHELESVWGKKYLVSTDRVIGLHVAGEARCYPLRVLNWHTTVNDVVGGIPVLVTFHGPCDSALVFDRRVDGRTRVFGDSGLLFNGNLIFYDRNEEPNQSSLFLQLLGAGIAGPLSGERLTKLPFELVSYGDWMERYPSSTIVPGLASLYSKCYKKRAYDAYLAQGQPSFEVSPLPELTAGRKLFDPLIVVERGDDRRVLFFDEIAARSPGESIVKIPVFDDLELEFVYHAGATSVDTATVYPRLGRASDVSVSYARYFAWHAVQNTELGPVTPPLDGEEPDR